jgi:two-component system, LytTR family, response regulator
MIKCLIVEDEFAAQQLLMKKIELFYPQIDVEAVINNKEEAIAWIDSHEPDLVFLDVQIKGGTGLEVLQNVTYRDFEAIFLTAYDNYAIEALNQNASYYLLKPIRNEHFQQGMNLVLGRIDARNASDFILVPNKGMQLSIKMDDILYLESDGAYTVVVTASDRYISSRNLGYYEKALPAMRFVRSHHSYIVNLAHIQAFRKGRSGVLILKNGAEIPVAQRRMNDFRDYFKE